MYVRVDDPHFVIRELVGDDIVSVDLISRSCFKRPWPVDRLAEYLDGTGKSGWVATWSGTQIGFALCVRMGNDLYLSYLAVDPHFQSRGAGRKLLSRVIDTAIANACTSVQLHCCKQDLEPCELYRSHGFSVVEELPDFYGDGIDGLHLRLAI